jgi:hypothetical protein
MSKSAKNMTWATLETEAHHELAEHQARLPGGDESPSSPNRSGPATHRVRHYLVSTCDDRRRV